MENLIVVAIVATIIAGALYFLLQRAPMIGGEIKQFGLYVIIGIYIIFMVFQVIIPLVRVSV